jgi:hypothetical protein
LREDVPDVEFDAPKLQINTRQQFATQLDGRIAISFMYGIWYIACMEKTTLYLPKEMQRALREAAKREGESQAVLIRRALAEYLERSSQPPLRSVGMGEDARLAARDAEDWLNAEWGGP